MDRWRLEVGADLEALFEHAPDRVRTNALFLRSLAIQKQLAAESDARFDKAVDEAKKRLGE